MFFFFQAEDGIRDLVRSRGLGDVYKRQAALYVELRRHRADHQTVGTGAESNRLPAERNPRAVSYTHLTLPTSDLV